jgi:hypothetical protein
MGFCNPPPINVNKSRFILMYKTIITAYIVLFFFTNTAVAQEDEIWACQGTKSNGFIFRSGSWEEISYLPRNLSVRLIGGELSPIIIRDITSDSTEFKYCAQQNEQEHFVSFLHCDMPSGDTNNFSLNKTTGKAVSSNTRSYFEKDVSEGASMYVSLYQCTKF